jgi:hypothetical protein
MTPLMVAAACGRTKNIPLLSHIDEETSLLEKKVQILITDFILLFGV